MQKPQNFTDNQLRAELTKLFARLDLPTTPISYYKQLVSNALIAQLTLQAQLSPSPKEDDMKGLYIAHFDLQELFDGLEVLREVVGEEVL